MKRLLAVVVALGLLSVSQPAKAEGFFGFDMSFGGFDASFGGLYGTGGYAPYQLAGDMFGINSYFGGGFESWYSSSWGGSCGSLFGSCSGGYDYANLFAFTQPMINVNIGIGSAYSYGYGLGLGFGYSMSGSSCGSGYSPYSTGSCGYNLGCGGGWGSPPQFPGYPSYPTYPTYPTTPVPPVGIVTPTQPTLPPWGGCGGPIQCPTGPVTPTTPATPTYTYNPSATPATPIRYNVPRGAH